MTTCCFTQPATNGGSVSIFLSITVVHTPYHSDFVTVCWFRISLEPRIIALIPASPPTCHAAFASIRREKAQRRCAAKATCSWPLATKLVNTHLHCDWNIASAANEARNERLVAGEDAFETCWQG